MHLRQVGLYTLDSPPHFIFFWVHVMTQKITLIKQNKKTKKRKKREKNEGFMDRMVNNVQLT